MGTVPGETSTIMKVLVILCLIAVAYAAPDAEPEADAAADAWYSYYGYGHPGYYGAYRGYYGLGGYGWGGYYGSRYYGYPGYGYRYWKRDAESEAKPEAEADPAVLYSSVYGHGLTYGAYGYPYAYGAYASPYYTYAHHPVTYTAAPAVTYAAAEAWYGRYYGGYGYGYPRYYGGYGGYYGRRYGYGYYASLTSTEILIFVILFKYYTHNCHLMMCSKSSLRTFDILILLQYYFLCFRFNF